MRKAEDALASPVLARKSALLAAGLFLNCLRTSWRLLTLRFALRLQVDCITLAIFGVLHIVTVALVLLWFLGLLLEVRLAERQDIAALFGGDGAFAVAGVIALDLAEIGHCHFLR